MFHMLISRVQRSRVQCAIRGGSISFPIRSQGIMTRLQLLQKLLMLAPPLFQRVGKLIENLSIRKTHTIDFMKV
jgi:hypothetical protein